jgi:LacI family transcriptional regulator
MIGLIVPNMGESYLCDVSRGITQAIRTSGYRLVVCPSQDDPELERQQIELLLSRQVDALMIVSMEESTPFLKHLFANPSAPLIFLGRRFSSAAGNFVGIDEERIGWLACEHLAASGCRRIAYLRGPHTATGDLRYSGFREALSSARLTFYPELVIDAMGTEMSEYQRGYNGMLKLFEARSRPDGVMAYSDMIAVGAIDAALSRNLRIPENIAIIGSGNETRLCEMRIPLTSIAISGQEVGQKAGRVALRLIEGKSALPARKVLVSPKLVVRNSTRGTR